LICEIQLPLVFAAVQPVRHGEGMSQDVLHEDTPVEPVPGAGLPLPGPAPCPSVSREPRE